MLLGIFKIVTFWALAQTLTSDQLVKGETVRVGVNAPRPPLDAKSTQINFKILNRKK